MNEPMNNGSENYLWDPTAAADPEVAALERILAPCSAASRLGVTPPRRLMQRQKSLWFMAAAGSAALVATIVWAGLQYRLTWDTGAAWAMTIHRNGALTAESLEVGEQVTTTGQETLKIDVARIGVMTIGPNSSVRLQETRAGRHRVVLDYGRLRAKVWAPPAQFAVLSGETRFTDMGCEFELTIDPAGAGEMEVHSGWVNYAGASAGVGVIEGHMVNFDAERISTPYRRGATPEFRETLAQLDMRLAAGGEPAELQALADRLASLAADADYFTLLRLLAAHPQLARGRIYDRLAAAFATPVDENHRQLWLDNDADAKRLWWDKVPKQPKRWWVNWRDAF
jgi:hypothetical protein